MSEDNNLFMDEITGLRLLHSFRENMQSHSAGEREKEFPSGERLSITDNIISAYLALLKKLKTQEQISSSEKKITDFIYQKLQEIKDDFNPFDYKTTDKKEDKSREKDKKEVDAHNKLVKKIKERIKTEIKGREKTTKEKGISIDDEPVSISIVLDKKRNCELYSIKFSQKSDPYTIMIYSNTKETKVENGLDKKIYKALHEKGEIELTERKKSDDIGEEYTLSKYKKLSGLGDEEQLKKEIEVINSLCKSDQDRFKEGVKKRKNFLKVKENKLSEYHTCIEKLVQQGQITAIESFKKYNSLIKKLLELPSELAKQKGLKYDIKDDFISEVIGKDEDIWSKYTKNNTDERSDHSYYEKMLIHITDTPKANKGNRCGQICKDLLTSTNKDIKQDIRDSFIEIQSMSNPKLPRRLAAEILTYGVFRAAISNPSEQNFNKMNKILNEFGLNIKFEKIEVTKLPDENVKDASDQYKKDREVFSATKKFHSHQKKEKDFAEYARKNGVTELKDKSKSVHHYIALKYNAFINEELNKDDNYIITGRQNPWNIDGHDLTHRFDTTGEAIIRFDDGNFKGLDFNGIRKAKKEAKNKKLSIWAPVLQKEEDGKFVDLLSKSDNKSNQGFYLSTDKSPEIIKVPPYCNGGDNGYGKLQSKGISLMKDDKGNKR